MKILRVKPGMNPYAIGWGLAFTVPILFIAFCIYFMFARGAFGEITAKAGDMIYFENKAPTTKIKVDATDISETSLIVLCSRNSGIVFVNILTDEPIMKTVSVDSLTVTAEGDTLMIPVEREIESGQLKNRNLQCSWVQYQVMDGNKMVLLIDVDGSEMTLPVEKVLRMWK